MKLHHQLICLLALGLFPHSASADPIVFEGTKGPGLGKHIVFIASDHEYRSEETLPALARILARHHGFKCTVVFGVDQNGVITPGTSHVPGIENLDQADLLVLFTRFQNWPDDQMQHFVDYLNRAGPIIGLRTATHAFRIPQDSKWAKYSYDYKGKDFPKGFGRQILGETWAGHYGKNHQQSTRIDLVPDKVSHPILRGVKNAWAQCGGYNTNPLEPSEVLAMAQPLKGMTPDAEADPKYSPVPAAWTRSYQNKAHQRGRVFTTTYGASGDIENEGFRRLLINACFWAVGLEDAIKPDLDVVFVGPYQPHWDGSTKRKQGVKPKDLAGWEAPIWPNPE